MTEPEGTIFGAEDRSAGSVSRESFLAELAKGATLSDLARDFVFFTPALLHTHARLDRDPVGEFVQESTSQPLIAGVPSSSPIFSGLRLAGDSYWNHIVMAVDRGHWNKLSAFLAGLVINDTSRKVHYKSTLHSLEIVDFLAMAKLSSLPDKIPLVGITVVGLDGNLRRVSIQKAIRPPHDLPWVRTDKPRRETVQFAREWFKKFS